MINVKRIYRFGFSFLVAVLFAFSSMDIVEAMNTKPAPVYPAWKRQLYINAFKFVTGDAKINTIEKVVTGDSTVAGSTLTAFTAIAIPLVAAPTRKQPAFDPNFLTAAKKTSLVSCKDLLAGAATDKFERSVANVFTKTTKPVDYVTVFPGGKYMCNFLEVVKIIGGDANVRFCDGAAPVTNGNQSLVKKELTNPERRNLLGTVAYTGTGESINITISTPAVAAAGAVPAIPAASFNIFTTTP